MTGWFANLRIAVKVTLAPALAIVGLVALAAGTYIVFTGLRNDFRYLNDTAFARFSDATRLQVAAAKAHALVYRITSLANANDTEQALAQTGLAKQVFADLVQRVHAQQGVSGNERTKVAVEAYAKAAIGALDMTAVDPAMAILLMGSGHEQFEKLSAILQDDAVAADRGRAQTFANALQAIDGSRLSFLLGAVAVTVLALAVTLMVTRAINRPVGRLTRVMGTLASGALDMDVPYADRRDELGGMARAVQVFKQQGVEAERLSAERELARETKERRQAALQQHTHDFGSTISGVMTSLAEAAERMRKAAELMARTASGVQSEASETAQAASRSSQDLTIVASAVHELTSSSGEIAAQVTTAAQVAHQAVARAEASRGTVQSLVEAADRIGDVVSLISDIAGRTNLLALNATIEAARAGEAGKGFAVVAGEVKALAAQTARATAEIGSQIEAMRSSTAEAVNAMTAIGDIIGKMNEVTAAISTAVEQQTVTTREIGASVQSVSSATAHTAQAMEQVVAAAGDAGTASQDVLAGSTEVGDEADTLRVEVDQFLAVVGDDTTDRRQFERMLVSGVHLRVQSPGAPARALTVRNIARGGAAVVCDHELPAGARLKIELPGEAGTISGRVARSGGGELVIIFSSDPGAVEKIDRALHTLTGMRQAA